MLAGTEQEVCLGGDGTPQVREFAATGKLGVLLGMTTHAARALMRDVLDLRHRRPLLWVAVREGRARFSARRGRSPGSSSGRVWTGRAPGTWMSAPLHIWAWCRGDG